jgi:DNA-binding transcriptional ArsR family regulator
MSLSPTLWRTCRVLSGPTRVALFRRIVESPGQCVSHLAKAERISLPRASQELRRLQSRGLVAVERPGRCVLYYPEADPLVASAKPILRAMQEMFSRMPASKDAQTARLAQGLAHEKRIALVRLLRKEDQSLHELLVRSGLSAQGFHHHLKFLEEGGWVERSGKKLRLAVHDVPLAKALLKLL